MTSRASVGGGARVRLFCALTLAPETVAALAAWQEEALPHGAYRLVRGENLHLTLAFLGHRPAVEVPGIAAELRAAAATAGHVELRVLHYRETRSAGMLALGDRGDAAGALAVELHSRLARLGVYEPEGRPWLPHLTVVRFSGQRPRLAPALPDLGGFSPSGAAVYHSVLAPAGAAYEIVESVRLGG